MVYLELIKNNALNDQIPIMQDETLNYLTNLINQQSLSKVLEIGSATGYSSIYLATHTKAKITTIEKDIKRALIALENIKTMNLTDQINLLIADALTVTLNEQFDLIIIDAAKTKHQAFFMHFVDNLSKNGYIMTDNLGLGCLAGKPLTKNRQRLITKTEDYQEFLINNGDFETAFLNIGDKIAISKRK